MKTVYQKSGNVLDSAEVDYDSSLSSAEFLNLRWLALCRRHLPVIFEDSVWRYNRRRAPQDAEQGWKLHISATILTAADVLEAVAPFLESQAAFYKAPVSLLELKKINSGIYYDYAQIGKFITVYPQNDWQAVFFAERLHQLTYRIPAPAVPYDLKFKSETCVYYRYGAFRINEIKNSDGTAVLAMRDRQGNLIPDLRDSEKPFPDWVSNPFPLERKTFVADDSPLKKDFRVFRALSQRGKGGVYQAFDISAAAPRLCLIKEGRKNGEVDWDGRDGFWRVRHEERVLKTLRAAGINVPQIYSSFEAEGNYYLATEFIAGESLHLFLKKRKKRLSISRAIKYAVQLSELITQIHSAGWLWRDCKPDNLIVTEKDGLRAVDFEGACLIKQPDPVVWSSLTVKSPEFDEKSAGQTTTVDLFALGAIIYLLLEGELPVVTKDSVPKILRRNVPSEIKQIVAQLLDTNTKTACLEARAVTQKLRNVGKSLKNFKTAA